jgi:tRNA A37 threonylcarbamoyladenosine biosynthesis protein TsaE
MTLQQHPLEPWRPFFEENDFEDLIQFVEKTKHNIANNKLLVLFGTGQNGKTKLMKEIANYIGHEHVHHSKYQDATVFFKPIVPLILIHDLEQLEDCEQLLKNYVQFGQSIIAETRTLGKHCSSYPHGSSF